MNIAVCTIFPELFTPFFDTGLLGKAVGRGIVRPEVINPRDFTTDRHRTVDDMPYGGGAGMVMKPEPLVAAVEHAVSRVGRGRVIYMSPSGRPLTQKMAERLSAEETLIILCGRYEGIDQRVIDGWVDEEISIGDYVLNGGEVAAMVLIEAVTRLLPGVVGNPDSVQEESHTIGLLEYPQYTRPAQFRGMRVPDILLSGHHGNVAAWRRYMMLRRTMDVRPDLLEGRPQLIEELETLEKSFGRGAGLGVAPSDTEGD